MKPGRMSLGELSEFLRTVSMEVERGASDQGSIIWSIPGLGDWATTEEEDAQAMAAHEMHVAAFVRNGNDMGQGGMWVVCEMDDQGQPVNDPPPPPPPAVLATLTEQRRDDIRNRMVNDIARANPMLGVDEVHDLAEHGMFHVEHLLAEIEGLRRDNSTRDVSRETAPTPREAPE